MSKVQLTAACLCLALAHPALAQETPVKTHQLAIKSYAFTPPKIVVRQGDVIEWTNGDIVRHDATADDKSWRTGDIKPRDKRSVKMSKAGTFAYVCSIHPEMAGTIVVTAATPATLAPVAAPQAADRPSLTAKAALKGIDGSALGEASLIQTPAGVLVKLTVKGLTPGEHAFHVHGVGKCEPPFTSAGGHFNPGGRKHGILVADGHHAGDMPNLHAPQNGEVVVEVVNRAITLEKGQPNSVFGANGTALIIHAGKDDYKTDPTGDAGGRVACGVIE